MHLLQSTIQYQRRRQQIVPIKVADMDVVDSTNYNCSHARSRWYQLQQQTWMQQIVLNKQHTRRLYIVPTIVADMNVVDSTNKCRRHGGSKQYQLQQLKWRWQIVPITVAAMHIVDSTNYSSRHGGYNQFQLQQQTQDVVDSTIQQQTWMLQIVQLQQQK